MLSFQISDTLLFQVWKLRVAFFISLLLCGFSCPLLAQENAWEENKLKDGITVLSREKSSEKTKEFRVEMEVEATLETLVSVIKNASLGTKWINRAVKFKTLEELTPEEWYSYTEIAIPWPFLNKDLITRNTLTADSLLRFVEISMISEPNFIPEKEGLSRLQHSEGVWRFEKTDKSKTLVSYEVFARSSGGLPAWVVTPIIVHGLYVTLKDMRQVVKGESRKVDN